MSQGTSKTHQTIEAVESADIKDKNDPTQIRKAWMALTREQKRLFDGVEDFWAAVLYTVPEVKRLASEVVAAQPARPVGSMWERSRAQQSTTAGG